MLKFSTWVRAAASSASSFSMLTLQPQPGGGADVTAGAVQ
jgi:hypothetical protein